MQQVPQSARARIAVALVTLVVAAVLAPLAPGALTPAGAAVVGLAHFPLEGPCRFYNNFGDYRSPTRSHEGEDIAPVPSPTSWAVEPGHRVYAALPGTVEQVWTDYGATSGAGNGIQLRHADGTYTRYFHLAGFAPGVAAEGVTVAAGQELGTAGDTGTSDGNYHLHFELHPGGGAAIDPVPSLEAIGGCPTTGGGGPSIPPPPTTTPIAVGSDVAGFVAMTPARQVDTRAGLGRVGAGGVVRVPLAGVVHVSASAVALNLTATLPAADGYLTAYPCGPAVPSTSSLNYRAGQTVPGAAVVGIGEDRSVCVTSYADSDVVVDLVGWFEPSAGAPLTPIAPVRLHDTRDQGVALQPGEVLAVDVTANGAAPAGATAVALNITATESAADGFITAWPCGQLQPLASTLNPVAGKDVANYANVGVGDGKVCFATYAPTHLVVDVLGWYGGMGARLTPVTPTRVVDTRQLLGGTRIGAGTTLDVDLRTRAVLPSDVSALQVTLTVSDPSSTGYLTAYGCGALPGTSNLNYTAGAIVANAAQAALSAGGHLCVYSQKTTDVIIDVTGVWR